MKKKQSGILPWFLLIILAVIWGSSYMLIKKGIVGLSPIQMGALRNIVACICLLPFAILNLRGLSYKQWGLICLSGFLGNFLPSFLFPYAQTHISSWLAAILNTLSPLFIVLINVLIYQQKLSWKKLIGITIAFGGSLMLILFKYDSSLKIDINFYALLAIVATICYGISANILKYNLGDLKAIQVTSLALLSIGPFAGIIFYLSDGVDAVLNNEKGIESAIYTCVLGILSTAVALWLFNILIKRANIVFASTVTYLMPLVAIIWGLADGEKLTLLHVLGICIILIGVIIVRNKD